MELSWSEEAQIFRTYHEKKMKTWRSASSQGWQKVLVEEEDRREPCYFRTSSSSSDLTNHFTVDFVMAIAILAR